MFRFLSQCDLIRSEIGRPDLPAPEKGILDFVDVFR